MSDFPITGCVGWSSGPPSKDNEESTLDTLSWRVAAAEGLLFVLSAEEYKLVLRAGLFEKIIEEVESSLKVVPMETLAGRLLALPLFAVLLLLYGEFEL